MVSGRQHHATGPQMQRGGIRCQITINTDVAALAMPVILWCSASSSDDSRAFQPDGRDRESGRTFSR